MIPTSCKNLPCPRCGGLVEWTCHPGPEGTGPASCRCGWRGVVQRVDDRNVRILSRDEASRHPIPAAEPHANFLLNALPALVEDELRKPVAIRWTESELAKLRAAAVERGVTVSEFVRRRALADLGSGVSAEKSTMARLRQAALAYARGILDGVDGADLATLEKGLYDAALGD